ncbi:MAG TPA: SET domain-containing protein [Candidatus Paceibacterota bacterium]|nr:SET domain-containing protein [Candidatus Paceibacterota bacterium]
MLLVKTLIGPSAIEGIGLFAAEDIPKGTLVWRFVPGFDLELTLGGFETLSEAAKDQMKHYAYISKKTGNYILCSDDARFFNHAAEPNVIEVQDENEQEPPNAAARDIKKGEELTFDYRNFIDGLDFETK